jgi:ABC-2 type transport system ATP-binding protein
MADVEINKLSKTFNKGGVKAVKEVSFTVEKGEIFGLIGPDGAGKTTLFRMLTTLLLADSGTARVNGFDIVKEYKAIRRSVGYMPGKFSLYQDLTVEENLRFFAAVFNTSLEENYELIKDIYEQLAPFKKRRAGMLSGGMKQKLALCCALIHKPPVLFLDEPTTGVDVVSRKEFWDMLKKLQQQNISILVSTSYMDEAKLCDRIALLQKGEILSVNTPENIIQDFPKTLFAAKAADIYALSKRLRAEQEVESCYTFGEYIHFTFKSNTESEERLKELAQRLAVENLVMKKIRPTIEDTFIRLMSQHTKKTAADGK